jgi:arabinan endo-1,5-alpha-L-arabinosidase
MLRLACLLFALLLTATAAPPRSYINPVLDGDFPDPALLRAPDGFYYAYATQTERGGRMIDIQVARSRDLVRWTHLGDALPAKPGWARRTQDFWAPHVVRHDGLYYLYYSARPDAALTDPKQGLCLAVATARKPQGPFTDSGRPLQCGEGFADIDPMAFDDPATGKRLLYWGSGFGPIKVRALAPDRLSFAPGSHAVDLVPPQKGAPYQELVEGAWMLHRGGWYFLFYSGDNCCGEKAHYAVMIARSRSATGPFEKRPRPILEAAGIWLAPGHNSLVEDAGGTVWMLYHAIDARRPGTPPNTRRVMLLDRVVWRGGWPVVEGPSAGPRPAPRLSSAPGS